MSSAEFWTCSWKFVSNKPKMSHRWTYLFIRKCSAKRCMACLFLWFSSVNDTIVAWAILHVITDKPVCCFAICLVSFLKCQSLNCLPLSALSPLCTHCMPMFSSHRMTRCWKFGLNKMTHSTYPRLVFCLKLQGTLCANFNFNSEIVIDMEFFKWNLRFLSSREWIESTGRKASVYSCYSYNCFFFVVHWHTWTLVTVIWHTCL